MLCSSLSNNTSSSNNPLQLLSTAATLMHNNLSIANEENNLDMLGNPTFTGVNNNNNANEIENINMEIENCNNKRKIKSNNYKKNKNNNNNNLEIENYNNMEIENYNNVNEIENNLEIKNCNDMFSFLFNNNKRINKTNRTPDKLQNRSLSNINTIINNFYNYFMSNCTKNNFNTNEKEIWKKYIGDLITQKNNVLSSTTVENNVINLIKYHSNNNDTASVNQLITLSSPIYS